MESQNSAKLKRIFPKRYLPTNKSFVNRKFKEKNYETEIMEYTN